ncbi:ATP-binding cassette domain-containing protein [Streptomyces purpurogeneiscleroticus]|uniref:ATP-binding cassette domain-containing protein n=1 Tax=Streptomyces purpurogeneiscleroticus TaxID=68259 RepID=UPI001CC0E2BF|nr:excinuclease ABC subunit UvrA [Streptomyces purpurogeneiscleroticus]MBZ4018072.1 daunorubicin resistance protein DrrC [Streptomyces purpurogeneiscleroticus]
MATDSIRITGAREHNLKDLTLEIPRGRLTVFTGVSGSGKSSVVFGTIAVESQRQLGETFGWYVRNRLPKHERPKADTIERLSPAVVVDQRPVGGNARSTVGTMTDIHPMLRVLYSRCGTPSAGEASAYSFNDPAGMCPECDGLGKVVRLDLERALDRTKSLNEGAIRLPMVGVGSAWWQMFAETGLFDPDKPLAEYTEAERELLLYDDTGRKVRRARARNDNSYEGLVVGFHRQYVNRDVSGLSERLRDAVRRFVREDVCPECGGARLAAAARKTQVAGLTLAEMTALEADELIAVLKGIEDPVGGPVAARAVASLERVVDIGLGYLSLDRETATLSGGEGQRLKTVRHLGSSLTGMTYIFDEPSIGLHPRDVARLNTLLLRLRDHGNTVLVVEHDPDVIAVADHVVDMGPGAGTHGGRVVYEGTVEGLKEADTATGRALRRTAGFKAAVREPAGLLPLEGVTLHNLKDVSVAVPTGVLTAVTGVAGSGKSTLATEALPARYPEAIVVGQGAIGASSRSTPATYLGLMDPLRRLFARTHGVAPGLFSFNSAGACGTCGGRGEIRTDLAFMDPVTRTCEACRGRRFHEDVLAMTVRGRSVADVLDMTAEQARDFLAGEPVMRAPLAAMNDVGLGYLPLGRAVSSLSGGERQRLKLATHLDRTGGVYVLDEPTTGLHRADVDGLLALLDRLVDAGNTVLVIEHDMDVVRHADWVIDLGPEGGRRGGEVLFSGAPRGLLDRPDSPTGQRLRSR